MTRSAAIARPTDLPDGFEHYYIEGDDPSVDTFERQMGPFWHRHAGDAHEFLFKIDSRHMNRGGTAHGGMLSAFSDMVCGSAYWHHAGCGAIDFVTASLQHDYLAPVLAGDWLLGRGRVRQAGGSMVFSECELYVGERLVGLSRCVLKRVRPRG